MKLDTTTLVEITSCFKRSRKKAPKYVVEDEDAANIFFKLEGTKLATEVFLFIWLDVSTALMGYTRFPGGCSQVIADNCAIMRAGVMGGAQGVVMVHNHPTGKIQPSQPDVAFTRKMKDAFKLVGIELVDHVIVNNMKEFTSMRGMHLIPF
jgi:DNA repair protein RadC